MVASAIMVTGANRGLGLELVRQMARADPPPDVIIATCRDPSSATELKALAEQSSASTKIHIRPLDVSDERAAQALFEEASKHLCPKGLSLLIHNAVVFPGKTDPSAFSMSSVEEIFRVNAAAPLVISKIFHPLLKRAAECDPDPHRRRSSISRAAVVMISGTMGSITATNYPQSFPHYAMKAAKAALNMITKCLAVEFAEEGIMVACVHPGWVRTELGGAHAALSPEEAIGHLIKTMQKMEPGKFHNYDYHESGRLIPW